MQVLCFILFNCEYAFFGEYRMIEGKILGVDEDKVKLG